MPHKGRRGSSDLDWISKYQQSDHHVDRMEKTYQEKMQIPTPSYSNLLEKSVKNFEATHKSGSLPPMGRHTQQKKQHYNPPQQQHYSINSPQQHYNPQKYQHYNSLKSPQQPQRYNSFSQHQQQPNNYRKRAQSLASSPISHYLPTTNDQYLSYTNPNTSSKDAFLQMNSRNVCVVKPVQRKSYYGSLESIPQEKENSFDKVSVNYNNAYDIYNNKSRDSLDRNNKYNNRSRDSLVRADNNYNNRSRDSLVRANNSYDNRYSNRNTPKRDSVVEELRKSIYNSTSSLPDNTYSHNKNNNNTKTTTRPSLFFSYKQPATTTKSYGRSISMPQLTHNYYNNTYSYSNIGNNYKTNTSRFDNNYNSNNTINSYSNKNNYYGNLDYKSFYDKDRVNEKRTGNLNSYSSLPVDKYARSYSCNNIYNYNNNYGTNSNTYNDNKYNTSTYSTLPTHNYSKPSHYLNPYPNYTSSQQQNTDYNTHYNNYYTKPPKGNSSSSSINNNKIHYKVDYDQNYGEKSLGKYLDSTKKSAFTYNKTPTYKYNNTHSPTHNNTYSNTYNNTYNPVNYNFSSPRYVSNAKIIMDKY